MFSSFDCSAVINVHREGVLLAPTLNSLSAAKREAARAGYRVEFVVVADNPDQKTLDLCRNWKDADSIHEVGFADLGRSRDFGIKMSSQRHVFMHDADDLFSSNLYRTFFEYRRAGLIQDMAVYHTEFFISFGGENGIRRIIPSDHPDFDPMLLTFDWFFSNKCVVDRELLERFPMPHNDKASGLGNEDWSWAGDTIANGVLHSVLPQTVCFYRVKSAHLSLGATPSMTQRASPLYSADYLLSGAGRRSRPRQPDTSLFATQEQLSVPVYEAMIEQVKFEPLISGNLSRNRWALTSSVRSLHHRAADGARMLLSKLDDRKKVFLFLSERYTRLLPVLIDRFAEMQPLFSPETHQLVIFHESDDDLYADLEIGDPFGSIYLSRRRMLQEFAVPNWFFNRFLVRPIVQHAGGTIIDTGTDLFAGLCEAFFKLVVSQTKRILLAQAEMTADPLLGLPQRRARVRRLLSGSKLYRPWRVHQVDLFGLCGGGGCADETGLSIRFDDDSAEAFLLACLMKRAPALPSPAGFVLERRRARRPRPDAPVPDGVTELLVRAGGGVSEFFVPSARRVVEFYGQPLVVLPQTMQHLRPDGQPTVTWYNFSNPEQVLRELIDRDFRGFKLGLVAHLAGVEMIDRFRKAGSLLKLFDDLCASGEAHLVRTTDPSDSRLAMVDMSGLGEIVSDFEAESRDAPSPAAALLGKFGVALTGSDYLSALRSARNVAQVEAYLSHWQPRREAMVDGAKPWLSETLAASHDRPPIADWQSDMWLPTTRFSVLPHVAERVEVESLTAAARQASFLPTTLQDFLNILSRTANVPVPPADLRLNWGGAQNTHRARLMERLAELGRAAAGGSFVVMPWLEAGGAELVGTMHFRAWQAAGVRNCRFVLTDRSTIVPKHEELREHTINLPELVEEITGRPYGSLGLEERQGFLAEFFRHARPRHVLYVQSYIGTLLLTRQRFGDVVQYAMFCSHVDGNGKISGYQTMIPEFDRHVDQYVPDNTPFAREIIEMYGLEPQRVATLLYPPDPTRASELGGEHFGDPSSRDVLWASRLDYQKNPAMILAVAAQMPELTFHVYGRRVMKDVEFNENDLPPNVIFHGGFTSQKDLMCRRYLGFLYTPRFDGMPLILLDMGSAGLPIVSPKVGGIPDFLGPDWPYVEDGEAPEGYVEALERYPT
ncbi:glycosyltransferase [Propylenella binzhouense]|uniref:Glycosyltransferase n=1 Tax=Propylenella binzhouense TaxID=2555902 RepID=A0A964T738_9HYPH|nr:glycosyltransferase [Propylenella binzhouense]